MFRDFVFTKVFYCQVTLLNGNTVHAATIRLQHINLVLALSSDLFAHINYCECFVLVFET